jgi:DNA-binding MarR family transcriptional regulator
MPLDALRASEGLTKGAVVVLSIIVDECARKRATEGVELSAALIGERGSLSAATVKRAIQQLERAGLIAHERTGRASRWTLTRAVELYPEGTFDGTARAGARQQQRRQRKPDLSDQERAELQEYLSLVNRFDDGEPIEGQPTLI